MEINNQMSIKVKKSKNQKELPSPVKLDKGKSRHDLISPHFTEELARCLQYGAEKYGENRDELPNYLKGDGLSYSRLIASLKRHLNKFERGINFDLENPDFPMLHIVQVAVNAMMLTDYMLTGKGVDDRLTINRINKDNVDGEIQKDTCERSEIIRTRKVKKKNKQVRERKSSLKK